MGHNINDYTIGKGVVSFKKDGDADYRDLGNVPEFEFTPEIENLEHFSSRQGVRTKDRTVVLSKSGSLRIVLEEWNVDNLALAFLGTYEANTAGQDVIQIFSESEIKGSVKFEGTNDVGVKYTYVFNSVTFIPGSAIGLISDEWGTLELTGNVQSVEGSGFGTITKTEDTVTA